MNNVYKSIKTEMFIDSDFIRQEFLIYIIDHVEYKIITYRTKYIDETVNLILEKYNQFNVDKVTMYYRDGKFSLIYESLCLNGIWAKEAIDIYKWRMTLTPSVRNRTYPIYYYEIQNYKFILEDEFIK